MRVPVVAGFVTDQKRGAQVALKHRPQFDDFLCLADAVVVARLMVDFALFDPCGEDGLAALDGFFCAGRKDAVDAFSRLGVVAFYNVVGFHVVADGDCVAVCEGDGEASAVAQGDDVAVVACHVAAVEELVEGGGELVCVADGVLCGACWSKAVFDVVPRVHCWFLFLSAVSCLFSFLLGRVSPPARVGVSPYARVFLLVMIP